MEEERRRVIVIKKIKKEKKMEEESIPVVNGIKVLVVDIRTCTRVLSRMLEKCGYEVTECEQHKEALKLLKEMKFDLVISNVSNASESDIDGFKLLEEIVGLEMNLPLIFLSADTRIETSLKAMQHGACYYIEKPARKKDVEGLWMHVVRRRNIILADPESSGSLEKKNNESLPIKNDETSKDAVRSKKKKRESTGEDDGELENGEEPRKKARFNWSGERHKQFIAAVTQLGIDNAVPKRILSLLNIPGLKREHVASHLQKYRLCLKKAEEERLRQQEKLRQQSQHINSPCGISLNPIMRPANPFISFQTLQPRSVTWNNHIPNIVPSLHTMPQIETPTNALGFQADSHDMLSSVVASQQPPARPMSLNNSLLINQNYSYRNMQQGSNDTLTLSNNLMGIGSSTSQAPSLVYQHMQQGSNDNLTLSNNLVGIGSSTLQAPSLVYRNMQQDSNDNLTLCNNLMGIGSSTSQAPSLASNNKGFNYNNHNGSLGSGLVQHSYSLDLVGTDRIESPSSNLTCGNSEAILNQNPWDLDRQM